MADKIKPDNMRDLRRRIDRLDRELVDLLNRRAQVVLRIGEIKNTGGKDVYVPAREKEVLDNVLALNRGPLAREALQAIYREIMSASLAMERSVRVAYLGPQATFSHQAARSRFGASVDYQPCETIADVFGAVINRRMDYGVVPIENSIEGAVTHTMDELAVTPLKICAEIYLRISHSLLATGRNRSRIKRVYSNPQVFGQCRNWLQANLPGVDLAPVSSTARAAEMAGREKQAGALASPLAAEVYGLQVLAREIQDVGGNTTRFLVLGATSGRATGEDKTSIMFAVKHRAGALHRVLTAFKGNRINLTRIESRPSRMKAWEYLFFVDIEGHCEQAPVRRALADMEKQCIMCTVLGSYPRAPTSDA